MAERRLKVYGWSSFRRGVQTREIVAAHSQEEAARCAGEKGPWRLWNLCETANGAELALAHSSPLTVFWQPLSDSFHGKHDSWRRA